MKERQYCCCGVQNKTGFIHVPGKNKELRGKGRSQMVYALSSLLPPITNRPVKIIHIVFNKYNGNMSV